MEYNQDVVWRCKLSPRFELDTTHKYPMDVFLNQEAILDANDFVCTSMVMLGVTGSCKTNTVAVIVEDFLKYNIAKTQALFLLNHLL